MFRSPQIFLQHSPKDCSKWRHDKKQWHHFWKWCVIIVSLTIWQRICKKNNTLYSIEALWLTFSRLLLPSSLFIVLWLKSEAVKCCHTICFCLLIHKWCIARKQEPPGTSGETHRTKTKVILSGKWKTIFYAITFDYLICVWYGFPLSITQSSLLKKMFVMNSYILMRKPWSFEFS